MDSHPAQHKENSPHPAQHKGTAPVHHQKMHPNPHNEPISPDRFKRYVKHICFMAKKHQQRDQSHDELEDKIKELKKVASSKKNINKEMNELKQKMDTVILHEKKISTPHQDPSQQQEMVQQAAKTVLEMKKHMGHLQKQVDAHLKDQKQLQESNKDLKAIIPLPEKDQKFLRWNNISQS